MRLQALALVVFALGPSGCSRSALEGRASAAVAFSSDEARSIEVLRQALTSRDYSVRLLATQGLGQVRAIDITPWLEQALGDPEHDVRVAAVDALSRVPSSRATDLLRSVRDDKTEALDIRALAATALIAREGAIPLAGSPR